MDGLFVFLTFYFLLAKILNRVLKNFKQGGNLWFNVNTC
jgi:hypothetical protein